MDFYILIDSSSIIRAYDFQCLTCDNSVDGPGCGEFTKQIPVRTCRTFCYFAIVQNRTEVSSISYLRAIRDCSPYDDMSIDNHLLLESKLGGESSQLEIITIKRCNSEQCNNDFYLKSDEFSRGRSSNTQRITFPCLFFLFMIIFYFQSMF